MREPVKQPILVVWALLLIMSELHGTHAQLHGRLGSWKPGGKKRISQLPLPSLDNRVSILFLYYLV